MVLISAIPEATWTWLIRVMWAVEVAVAFGLLIMIHEFGHFIFGKLTGMKVEEFSIGFGKRIVGWKKGETDYSIRLVPLGGYCKIYGMEDEGEIEAKKEDSERGFLNKPLWARFLVIIAGSTMNVVLAVILIASAGIVIGYNYSLIFDVVKGGPADRSGIKPGDKIRLFAYNSRPYNIGDRIRSVDPARGIELTVANNNGTRKVIVHPEIETDEEGKTVKRIGVVFDENGNYSRAIDKVMYDSPYYKAGLLPGDIITEIDGQPVTGIITIAQKLMEAPDDEVNLKVKRGENEFKFKLSNFQIRRTGIVAETVESENGYELLIKNVIFDTPAMGAMLRAGMRIIEVDGKPITKDFNWAEYEMRKEPVWISLKVVEPRGNAEPAIVEIPRVMIHPGIGYKEDWIRVPFHTAIVEALSQTRIFGRLIFDSLASLFTRKADVSDISGPIAIISITYKAASGGIIDLIFFVSLISVNLGIINLLPIPGLDGGRAVFLIAELIIRKPVVNARLENFIHFIGIIVLFAFIILVTYFDFTRLFSAIG